MSYPDAAGEPSRICPAKVAKILICATRTAGRRKTGEAALGLCGFSRMRIASTRRAGRSFRYSISKVRAVALSTVMRTWMVFSGSSGSIFSGHSTRQMSPE